MAWSLEREAQRLYRLPLDRFTQRRNARAKELKDEGKKKQAEEVRSLRRPTVAAWVVDQLAHERAAQVKRLAKAAETIAQERSAAKVRKAMEARRDVIADLVEDAEDILQEAGRKPSAQVTRQVARTLTSATSTDERETLVTGTFTRPLASSGFEQALAMTPPPKLSKTEERLLAQLEEVQDELRRRKKQRTAANSEAKRARRALRDAQQDAEAADKSVDRLERKAKKLKKKLR